ncbi:MAG: cell surface protein SprA [Bacteroidota bacterium]
MKKGNLLLTLQQQFTHKVADILRGRALWILLPLVALITHTALANRHHPPSPYDFSKPTATTDTIPIEDRYDDYINNPSTNPFDLEDPSIINQEVEYDPETNQYIITERIGEDYYRMPTYMTFEEYLAYKSKQQERSYFDRLSNTSEDKKDRKNDKLAEMLGFDVDNPLGKIDIEKSLSDRLFGGSEVNIRPQGSIDLTLGLERSVIENPVLTERQQRPPPQLLFNMVPQIDVTGGIGEKLNLNMNYNSQATFDFDRQIMKLEYASDAFSEDDIIKSIEAGNVTLPLNGSLIQGAQSLFGLKTQLQFGRLFVTGIASQQKSEREQIQIKGGSQVQEFEVFADEYDENRNFLLSYFNRESFNQNLGNLPQILSLFNIKNIEVWVTNDRNVTANSGEPGPRDIIALSDLGEGNVLTNPSSTRVDPNAPRGVSVPGVLDQDLFLPDNNVNDLFQRIKRTPGTDKIDRAVSVLQNNFGLQQARDFEKVSARRLREGTEYTVNKDLGFVSLNINLQQDQVLGVAFQYYYNGQGRNGTNIPYQVGEMSVNVSTTQATRDTAEIDQKVLFVKMLKSTTPRVDIPLWDLMMKNFYNIGAYQVDQKDFRLDVFYEDTGIDSTANTANASDPGRGRKRFLPATNLQGQPLIRVFNLDELNVQGDPGQDGVFDFVPGLTIYPRTGRIMFPVLEPFGDHLAEKITDGNEELYVYNQLYDSTQIFAREFPELNRFSISGEYRSSVSSEISLGAFNIPPGSVTVTAGGRVLIEGQHYEIDYNIGRVRILDDSLLSSGVPINVSFENNALFGFQTKTMVGLRADYKFNENFILGGTFLQLLERPFTQKVNIGDDPINNKIYGLDLNYSADAPWLTRMVDKIPFIDTKAPSTISLSAEVAALRPGHSRAINEQGGEDKGGILYLDDFEGSASGIDLRQPANDWVIASIPQGTNMFPEADLINDNRAGANRARINWYRIDPILRNNNGRLNSVRDELSGNPYTALIPVTEIFPNRTIQPNQQNNIFTFDLNYDPAERGPYNFDVPGGYTGISRGLRNDGRLESPDTRWGGIMRDLNINNFEQSNVQFIEFWLLSPFLSWEEEGRTITKNRTGGDLYIDLGNISEDILRDSRKFFENGLPGPANPERRTTTTEWGNVPISQQVVNAFDIDIPTREAQDVGLDGLDNIGEQAKFSDFLNSLSGITATVREEIFNDPANDDFLHYLEAEDELSLFEKYEKFNNQQGNSREADGQNFRSGTNIPDAEDLNQDNTLNETEAYFQYRIPIRPNGNGIAASDFITDERLDEATGRRWYRFRIPLDTRSRRSIGGIQDLRSVRFIRMYLKDFEEPVTMRFGRLELVRNQWRIYQQDLSQNILPPDFPTEFDLNAVNIEENSSRCRFNYVLPLGIEREQTISAFQGLQNEQSIALRVKRLADGDARAVYKTLNIDLRNYERLKMFIHAEKTGEESCPEDSEEDIFCDPDLEDGEVTAFIRLGSDFLNNYYEYEIPLDISEWDSIPIISRPTDDNRAPSRAFIEEVWKDNNEFDVALEWLKDAKITRNQSGTKLSEEFTFDLAELPEGHALRIKGNPNLGYVKAMMIGIRNPKDDGESHCVEIWANELRMQGLNEQGGVAAIARVDMQLADFGNISASANYSSIGFGALDQQLNERALDEVTGFDVSGNFELSRFLPVNWGLRLPAYAAYSRETTRPKFDPYDLDIPLNENLALADNAEERQEIKERSQEVTEIKTLSLNNVGKEKTNNGASMPWDISNFSASYAYTETDSRDPLIESDRIASHEGTVDYTYAIPLQPLEPFKKLPDKDWLKVLRDLNFSPLPNSLAFSTTVYREQVETKYRFTDLDPVFSTFYNKQFNWERTFDLRWDFSKALKINFGSTSFSVIDEPNEADLRNPDLGFSEQQVKNIIRDSIWTNVQNLGRPKNYQHNLSVNFTLPSRSIPLLDWIDLRGNYTADYGWAAAALNGVDLGLGNIIQNGQNRKVDADLNFDKLYDKWDYLKQINRPAGRRSRSSRGRSSSSRSSSKSDKDDKKKKQRKVSKFERTAIRPLLLVRKLKLTYNEDFGTSVPGFTPNTQILGLSQGFEAPGWDFVAGLQPRIRLLDPSEYGSDQDWLHQISNARGGNSWITPSFLQNQDVLQTYTQSMDASLQIEPFADFRLELFAQRNFREDHSRTFKNQSTTGGDPFWEHSAINNVGTLDITYTALNTFFNGLERNDIRELVSLFKENRLVASEVLGVGTHDNAAQAAEGFTFGYGSSQQDVLASAFIAAYRGERILDVGVQDNFVRSQLFDRLPVPNWRLNYNGLSKIPLFKDLFENVMITHAYSSNLAISQFNTNLLYEPRSLNSEGNFYSRLEIPEIVIQEAFSPLIGINVTTQSGISLRANVNRARSLSMFSLTNTLAETQTQDYQFSFGWIMSDVNIGFLRNIVNNNPKKKKKKADADSDPLNFPGNNRGGGGGGGAQVGDLDININFSFRDDVTYNHRFDEDTFEPTRGTQQISFSPAAEYQMHERLALRIFFDYTSSKPRTSQSFPVSNSAGGVVIRFTLNE